MRARATTRQLTLAQHFALAAYAPDIPVVFKSLDDAREAWQANRADLMARCEPKERPEAFWVFEGPPSLVADDPAEPIVVRKWVEATDRPQIELPRRTEAQIADFQEREAREARLDHRRRLWLAKHPEAR